MKLLFMFAILLMSVLLSGCGQTDVAPAVSTDSESSEDELHDHSVEIEGREMKVMTVQEIAHRSLGDRR
ncbi:MAG: hypothetical protein ABIC95_03345 [archaeon]